jgi:BlaI family transcriptional regulator, penicillinase repressor
MAKRNLPRPTDAELEILNVIFRRGPSTVREVHEEINRRKPMVYTTVLKMMQIMADKGLLNRDESARAHLYATSLTQEETQQQLVGDLLQRAFEGSASSLVMRALSSKKTSREELNRIKAMLKELEGDK